MKAWELLDSADKWTQHAFAVDTAGVKCAATSPQAVRWCLMGAIERCHVTGRELNAALKKVRLKFFGESVSRWQDACERKYEDVHAVLKELDL